MLYFFLLEIRLSVWNFLTMPDGPYLRPLAASMNLFHINTTLTWLADSSNNTNKAKIQTTVCQTTMSSFHQPEVRLSLTSLYCTCVGNHPYHGLASRHKDITISEGVICRLLEFIHGIPVRVSSGRVEIEWAQMNLASRCLTTWLCQLKWTTGKTFLLVSK
jgi:hypothetical protein